MNTRADRASETRYRIERAALKHFVEKGIGETTIRDIANTANVSLGAMYNHFASKEELAWQLFIDGFNHTGRNLRERAETEETLAGQLRAMIGYAFERFDEDPLLLTYVFASRQLHLQPLPKFSDNLKWGHQYNNPYLAFRTVIVNAMDKKTIPDTDPDLATSLVIGAAIQIFDSRILGRLKGKLRPRAEETAAMCLRMLSG